MKLNNLCGLNPEEILNLAAPWSATRRHAIMIANSLYKKRIKDLENFPGIPGKVREGLLTVCNTGLFEPVRSEMSSDKSVKFVFRNEAGLRYETVYITEEKRRTVCVSTQSGCRMACPFCMTGRYGFYGNLSAGEIINQVLSLPYEGRITHVVFMGMGEPMDNLENVLKACSILTAEWGVSVGIRNVTVSTVGIEPSVKLYLERSDCNLSFSLFSPFPEERIKVIAAEKKYPAHRIINLMKTIPAGSRRRMTIAYVMMKGINDTERHLEALKRMAGDSGIRINLIPYHRIPGDSAESSSPVTMQHFRHHLMISGISASVRKSRGIDVAAACGLLGSDPG